MVEPKQGKKLPDVPMRSSKMINPIEYTTRTYEDLSTEFKLSVCRAAELVPLMYNRLTLVDMMSHKAAMIKMYKDHRHLPGFSERNIRRYLPICCESVPRRIRPTRPNNSLNEKHTSEKLSNTKQLDPVIEKQKRDVLHFEFFVSREEWWEHFVSPLSRLVGEDMVRVKVELDKRTEMAIMRID